MRTREFLSKVKEGSKVVLKSNLKDSSIYGGESYLREVMKGPGPVVTVSKIFNKNADHDQVEFYIKEENSVWPYYYTPAMVDHIEAGETEKISESKVVDSRKIAYLEKRKYELQIELEMINDMLNREKA